MPHEMTVEINPVFNIHSAQTCARECRWAGRASKIRHWDFMRFSQLNFQTETDKKNTLAEMKRHQNRKVQISFRKSNTHCTLRCRRRREKPSCAQGSRRAQPGDPENKGSQTQAQNTDKGPAGQTPAEYINTKQAASEESTAQAWGKGTVTVKQKLRQ